MENNKLKIGIIGLGTVGCGVVKVLEKFSDIEIVLAFQDEYVEAVNELKEMMKGREVAACG